MNEKHCGHAITIISTLLMMTITQAYADSTNSCTFYAKFVKSDTGYIVESAAKSYIDSENVLIVELGLNTDKVVLRNMRVPYREFPNANCRTVGTNDYQALCGGYFVTKQIGKTAVVKPLMYVFTLGIGAIIDTAGGVAYAATSDVDAVNAAKESSNILTSPYTAPYFQSCASYYDEQHKAEIIKQKNQQEADAAIKKQQELAKMAYSNWIASMPKYRSQLKPSIVTNCGTVIEIKGTMVHLQTGSDARDIWMPLTDVYSYQDNQSRLVGCHDSNRWYKRYGNWVNGDTVYKNGKDYNDEL